jgi:hypothetical protein
VRIRSRKPWVLARRRLFGWKVRLLTTTPQRLEDKECGQRRRAPLHRASQVTPLGASGNGCSRTVSKTAPQQVNYTGHPTGAGSRLALTLWRTSTDRLGAVSVLRHRTFPTSQPGHLAGSGRPPVLREALCRVAAGSANTTLASACPCTDCG